MEFGVTDELAAQLAGFSGRLLLPGDPGYEHARGVHNALIDRRPALIAQCNGVADVAAAVGFAREHGLAVSVRGGGHNVAGTAVVDGGVMVDLSHMKGIRVDPGTGVVRAQGGVTWGELDRETQVHGLAVTGGTVSTTGIAGVTLGGGRGWLMSKHGLTVDNLRSADVVTADGTVLVAREEEHEDLFWALRGGGGNFGIVTSFEYGLHRVGPVVTGGFLLHPYAAAGDLLRLYRDLAPEVPDELGLQAALVHSPGASRARIAALAVCHAGSPEQAVEDLRPLLSFGSPAERRIRPMSYVTVNAMLDAAYLPGLCHYWKSSFLADLSDAAIDAIVDRFERVPSPLSAIAVERVQGAVCRLPVAATAWPHREPAFHVVVASTWAEPGAADENVAWARATYAALEPHLAGRRWLSFLDWDDTGADAVRSAYGPNASRLAKVKAAYDPTNFFQQNVTIYPAPSRKGRRTT